MRGAWIEIAKSDWQDLMKRWSLPVRGAWIEILHDDHKKGDFASLPVRGAWIEIV